jgi:hypothetical protein
MKTIKISILVCLFVPLFVGSSYSASLVTENPVNIVGSFLGYNYVERNPPYWYPGDTVTETIMFVGSEGASGGYFQMVALINPGFGSCLTDHSQIREVKAEWLGEEPGYAFSLLPDICLNQLPTSPTFLETQAWGIDLRPSAWQFQAPWRFTLIYDCPKDRKQHIQTREVQSNPPNTIPPKPAGILIEKSGDYFYVSWIGMGKPMDNPFNQPWDQRVVVYEDEYNCPTDFFGNRFGQSGSAWSYADGPNRITIKVPTAHIGKTIRIENRNSYGMATSSPPGTLGGTPNRAVIRTRLPN